uniref:Uncharacterized protein n=1 Tax=Chromera velia CCMP2878 TaxID=1169474 RepID=A0A0G4F6F9_9ALVE|eukprot:Cvel_15312.t1-p1 / transcript=Cvel_15312.t1 / gene=Cvel_15312 / organism=Chromera_velia_CCMP2878 / gene_product=hypothetical protein / transcript_product=hypothetical protein / location=Cvel_scaffold1125:39156-47533(-) / protein_length=747 / sequence_SO=supercontig / SO=protein_coding / is_pseudo=false
MAPRLGPALAFFAALSLCLLYNVAAQLNCCCLLGDVPTAEAVFSITDYESVFPTLGDIPGKPGAAPNVADSQQSDCTNRAAAWFAGDAACDQCVFGACCLPADGTTLSEQAMGGNPFPTPDSAMEKFPDFGEVEPTCAEKGAETDSSGYASWWCNGNTGTFLGESSDCSTCLAGACCLPGDAVTLPTQFPSAFATDAVVTVKFPDFGDVQPTCAEKGSTASSPGYSVFWCSDNAGTFLGEASDCSTCDAATLSAQFPNAYPDQNAATMKFPDFGMVKPTCAEKGENIESSPGYSVFFCSDNAGTFLGESSDCSACLAGACCLPGDGPTLNAQFPNAYPEDSTVNTKFPDFGDVQPTCAEQGDTDNSPSAPGYSVFWCSDNAGTFLGESSDCSTCLAGACCLPGDNETLPMIFPDTYNDSDAILAKFPDFAALPDKPTCAENGDTSTSPGYSVFFCQDNTGTFLGAGSDCSNCLAGSCCFNDAVPPPEGIVYVGGTCGGGPYSSTFCEGNSGRFLGENTECPGPPLSECLSGACCFPNKTCSDLLSQEFCEASGGFFLGNGTECPDGECLYGACCGANTASLQGAGVKDLLDDKKEKKEKDLSCVVLESNQCRAARGLFQGHLVECDGDMCPMGACCVSKAGKTELTCKADETPRECDLARGIYQGTGVPCEDAACPTNNSTAKKDGLFDFSGFKLDLFGDKEGGGIGKGLDFDGLKFDGFKGFDLFKGFELGSLFGKKGEEESDQTN